MTTKPQAMAEHMQQIARSGQALVDAVQGIGASIELFGYLLLRERWQQGPRFWPPNLRREVQRHVESVHGSQPTEEAGQ